MLGPEGGRNILDGIIPKSLHSVFTHIKGAESPEVQFQARMSFIEIYNNKVTDLLIDSPTESMRRSSITTSSSTECVVRCTKDAMALITSGSKRRHTRETDMNVHSSRSHAIVTLHLEKRTKEGKASRKYTSQICKFNFVDLAGSESCEKSGTLGSVDGMRETASINTGLLVLHRVISALQKGDAHVPYRDHPLTQILQSSLGGDSQTLFLAHISPLNFNTSESLSTIACAKRAMSVMNTPKVHIEEKEEELLRFHDDVVDSSGLNRRSCFLSTSSFGRVFARCAGSITDPLILLVHGSGPENRYMYRTSIYICL
jgi:hypothetical protein